MHDKPNSDGGQPPPELKALAATNGDIGSEADADAGQVGRNSHHRSPVQRERTPRARLDAGEQRDRAAEARDLAAAARDRSAAEYDALLAERDAAARRAEILIADAGQRERVAKRRIRAAEYRAMAARDREAAARDRAHAARDRLSALADRVALVRALASAETDALTGTRTRAAGLIALDHELDRARRTDSALAVVYVDVIGLKCINDSVGHAAGDELLRFVTHTIRGRLRPYDLVTRLGGDEFLCVLPNMTLEDARERFVEVTTTLAEGSPPAAIRTGLAALAPGDTAAQLIARADAQLICNRND